MSSIPNRWPAFASLITLVTGLLFCMASSADTEFVELTVSAVYIDVRSGPGKGYPVFHALERGEKIKVGKQRTDWFKVIASYSIADQEGWVHRDDLTGSLYADGSQADFSLPKREDLDSLRWSFSGMGGDFGGADSLNLTLGYRLTSNLTLEARVGRALGSFSDTDYGYLRLHSQPFPDWRVSPFFLLGAGRISTSFNTQLAQIDDIAQSTLQVGLGLQTYVTRNFVARFEFNQHLVLQTDPNSNEDINEWLFGFSVFF